MNMNMNTKHILVIVGVLLVVFLAFSFIGGDVKKSENVVGAVTGPDYYEPFRFHDSLSSKSEVISVTATATATPSQSGAVVAHNAAAGVTVTLPRVSNAGVHYKFVVSTAFDTSNFIVRADPADTDKMEGTLIVAGAVVDCDAEDQINFVNTGENVGDFVELFSTGSKWIIGQSGGLTAAAITCTS